MKKNNTVLTILFLAVLLHNLPAQNNTTATAFSKSIEKEKHSDYTGAIKTMTDLNDSTSYEVMLRLGWLNYKAGFKKKSILYYQKAIDLMPGAIEPRLGFGFPAYQLEDFTDLEVQDKKILEIDPNNKATNANLGLIYYYDKQYQKALPLFQKVVNLYPFDYDNNLMLAWTYLRLDKKAEAEQYFKITLLYSPADASAKEGLEAIGKLLPENDKLINAFSKSYELTAKSDNKGALGTLKEAYDPSSYFINLRLAWLSHLTGAEPDAISYYKIAAELKPNAVEPRLGYVIPMEAMGNKNELKGQYTAVLAIDPQNTPAHYKLGLLLYENKEYAQALEHFEKIVRLYPFDYDGLLMLAWTNYQLNKNDEARTQFNKVLCLAPGDASATKGLALKPVEEQKKLDQKPSPIKPR